MPVSTRIALVSLCVVLALSFTPLDALANEVFNGACDTCHSYGVQTGPWHIRHLGQPCISQDCDYCHTGTILQRSHCNECHRGAGTANNHDCSGADTGCITCHTGQPPAEGTDYTSCLNECADGLDNDGNCDYDTDDVDCDAEICNDQVDNDGDLLIDGDDPDCLGVLPEICTDGIDNDCDGQTDSADSDCGGGPCTAGAEASTYGPSPVHGTPDLFRHTAPLFFLAGLILAWRTVRRKK